MSFHFSQNSLKSLCTDDRFLDSCLPENVLISPFLKDIFLNIKFLVHIFSLRIACYICCPTAFGTPLFTMCLNVDICIYPFGVYWAYLICRLMPFKAFGKSSAIITKYSSPFSLTFWNFNNMHVYFYFRLSYLFKFHFSLLRLNNLNCLLFKIIDSFFCLLKTSIELFYRVFSI